MRKELISKNTVKRLIDIEISKSKDKYLQKTKNTSVNSIKELPKYYELQSIHFDVDSLVAHLEILQKYYYRTIERYVTQNYVRNPIYSDWKIKTKKISTSVHLSNLDLENLNKNDDSLIRQLSDIIVFSLDSEEFYPSWFILKYLRKEHEYQRTYSINHCNQIINENNIKIQQLQSRINKNNEKKQLLLEKRRLINSKCTKMENKLNRIEQKKKSILLSIITFGIYAYCLSDKRKSKIRIELENYKKTIHQLSSKCKLLSEENRKIEIEIKKLEENSENYRSQTSKQLQALDAQYKEKYVRVRPLQTSIRNEVGFVPLKIFIRYTYEKIIGCYIIRNKEKEKYYVGQSKDVFKRIRQHFRGTVPINIIFAQDYYLSRFENKADIFEIKIIPCQTKDELDMLEKQLIAKYNAFTNGYNSTVGNT